MKTTLDLPDELVREVKLRAVVQGRTVKDLVTELLSQGLGLAAREAPPKPPVGSRVETDKRGLPVIRCDAEAPAARMNLNALLKLERDIQLEEDLQRAGLPL